ncbi:HNH endonuclease [Arthrobacter rhizosphaerae]|uniref:HNH endonuclease n=1 Tax=Arthrobacter rhizosphaerae TaxID=2855490 RepID=UPI003558F19C
MGPQHHQPHEQCTYTHQPRTGSGGHSPGHRPRRKQAPERAGTPALHRPRHWRPHRDGLPRPALPTRAAPLHPGPDHTCRTPYCDAPIRHLDHITPWHHNGTTTTTNGQGLCEACNHTKETPGWTTHTRPGPRHTTELHTPTGHTYHSTAPPLPGGTSPESSYTHAFHYQRRALLHSAKTLKRARYKEPAAA